MKKDYADLEKKNSDLKVEYEKLKYAKNKAENDLSLLKKKFQALQNQLNVVDIPKQNQDVVSRKEISRVGSKLPGPRFARKKRLKAIWPLIAPRWQN